MEEIKQQIILKQRSLLREYFNLNPSGFLNNETKETYLNRFPPLEKTTLSYDGKILIKLTSSSNIGYLNEFIVSLTLKQSNLSFFPQYLGIFTLNKIKEYNDKTYDSAIVMKNIKHEKYLKLTLNEAIEAILIMIHVLDYMFKEYGMIQMKPYPANIIFKRGKVKNYKIPIFESPETFDIISCIRPYFVNLEKVNIKYDINGHQGYSLNIESTEEYLHRQIMAIIDISIEHNKTIQEIVFKDINMVRLYFTTPFELPLQKMIDNLLNFLR